MNNRVLFIHDGPVYTEDNISYYAVDYSDDMKKRYMYFGDQVTFLTRVKKMEKCSGLTKLSRENLSIIKVEDFKDIKKYFYLKKEVDLTIENAVKEHDFLIIRLPSVIGLIAYKFALKYNKRFMIELVACPWDGYVTHSNLGKLIAPIIYIKTKRAINNAPYVIYVTKEFLQNRYPTNGKSIGCSDVILHDSNIDIINKRKYKINNMKSGLPIILGSIGAVNMKYKGHKYVIKSIAKLKKKNINVEYHIVGGGDRSYLLNIAKKYNVEDKVRFKGVLPHSEIKNFLQSIDIYIQPSNTEALSRAVIEAMSSGCPIIASSVGGNPELINKEFLFERRNVNQLVDKIEKLISENLIEISIENYNKSKEYIYERLNNKRNSFYKEILKEG